MNPEIAGTFTEPDYYDELARLRRDEPGARVRAELLDRRVLRRRAGGEPRPAAVLVRGGACS